MSDGRTIWRAKDASWWRREWIVVLGEEFGADGPAVIDWLECEAKLQNDGGRVKAGQRTVARGCFVDVVTVGHVLSRSVTLGLLEEFDEDNGRFTCRISGWQADQARASAAGRKAAQRSRETDDTGESTPAVTVSHGESRSVTKCPPTEQERTVLNEGAKAPSRRARSKSVDQDSLPDSLPEHLHGVARTAHPRLLSLQEQRGGHVPTLRGTGLAVGQFSDRDFEAVLSELEHWALVGYGRERAIKDWNKTFRTFLGNSAASAPSRPASLAAVPSPRPSKFAYFDEAVARKQAREAGGAA